MSIDYMDLTELLANYGFGPVESPVVNAFTGEAAPDLDWMNENPGIYAWRDEGRMVTTVTVIDEDDTVEVTYRHRNGVIEAEATFRTDPVSLAWLRGALDADDDR